MRPRKSSQLGSPLMASVLAMILDPPTLAMMSAPGTGGWGGE